MSYTVMWVWIYAFSFQKCSPGFYRDGRGPYLGPCVPCECNGLADECEERTGRCLVRNTFTLNSDNSSGTKAVQYKSHYNLQVSAQLLPVCEPEDTPSEALFSIILRDGNVRLYMGFIISVFPVVLLYKKLRTGLVSTMHACIHALAKQMDLSRLNTLIEGNARKSFSFNSFVHILVSVL